jgi:hypothetical protein
MTQTTPSVKTGSTNKLPELLSNPLLTFGLAILLYCISLAIAFFSINIGTGEIVNQPLYFVAGLVSYASIFMFLVAAFATIVFIIRKAKKAA